MWRRCFPVCFLIVFFKTAAAQVVLTEVMFNPAGSDSHDEFVEIVNLSASQNVDLSGWQISDGSGIDAVVAYQHGTLLQPGQIGLILDPSYFENSQTYDSLFSTSCIIVTIDNTTFGSRGLSNSVAETVILTDAAGNPVDFYLYTLDNEPGYSDEKVDLGAGSEAFNWQNSRVYLGTPGKRNSVSPLSVDLSLDEIKMRVSEESGAVTVGCRIRNAGNEAVNGFRVHFLEISRAAQLTEIARPVEFTATLAPADSAEIWSEAWISAPGWHEIVVKVDLPADEAPDNNKRSQSWFRSFNPGVMRINEIMYQPREPMPEWLEI
jgi:hypothetical protein